jgi:alkylation response protein AidB-like acyl-CoA dehydrogenase
LAVLDEQQLLKGGAFLTSECAVEEAFTPEDFTEEHRMIAETTRRFVDNEVTPRLAQLEQHDWRLARDLVRHAAELGLIGATIPAAYGGLGLNHISGALIAENTGRCTSFATTCCVQTGVGLWPIIHFGSDTARLNYLPRIASGELITAYALTEATAGSDALAARATARLSQDGTHYILNGEKVFVTNGGLADIFIVFAKVDDGKLTAFIVDAQEGVSPGLEERKMGVRGSSTTSLLLTDAKVPRENLLGEVGMGDKIAFGILNLGRCKLGAICVGAMKLMVEQATRYAGERKQFGRSISSFGTIRAKLAEMTIRTWVGESMVYRTLGLIEGGIRAIDSNDTNDANDSGAWLRPMDEYAAECSIVKVAVSEYCNYVADEMVQIYGGYGYLADYPAERAYRDSRLNRIGEGTNEINRLLISSRLMKYATAECPSFADAARPLSYGGTLLRKAKTAALTSLRLATQMNKLSLSEQQAIMLVIADIIIDTYAMESAILRTQKAGAPSSYVDMTEVFCADAMQRIEANVKNTISAIDRRGPLAVRQRIARAIQS